MGRNLASEPADTFDAMERRVESAIAVRALTLQEWPLLRDVRLRALADAPDAFGRTFEEERGRPDAEWEAQLARSVRSDSTLTAVAERDGEAVGFVHAQVDADEPPTAELFGMWVAPAARRSGAGRALVDAIAAWARSRGAVRLVLNVTEGNTAAERLYERAGLRFTADDPVPLREGSPLRARRMERTL
jgi:ribosomal protein S18 acetylase RimI-like enzyme